MKQGDPLEFSTGPGWCHTDLDVQASRNRCHSIPYGCAVCAGSAGGPARRGNDTIRRMTSQPVVGHNPSTILSTESQNPRTTIPNRIQPHQETFPGG